MKPFLGVQQYITHYIGENRGVTAESRAAEIETYLGRIRRFKELGPGTSLLEVGSGLGWFTTYCTRKGFRCTGLDASRQMHEEAVRRARAEGVDAEFILGSVDEADFGTDRYDVVFASSVFEHVLDWKTGLRRVHASLKPGGLLYFYSTNRYSLVSGENPLPLYGWLPDAWRYQLQIARAGEDISGFGMDYHHFTYPQLRWHFRRVGFSKIFDQFDIVDAGSLVAGRGWKRFLLRFARRPPIRELALTFSFGTLFICIK